MRRREEQLRCVRWQQTYLMQQQQQLSSSAAARRSSTASAKQRRPLGQLRRRKPRYTLRQRLVDRSSTHAQHFGKAAATNNAAPSRSSETIAAAPCMATIRKQGEKQMATTDWHKASRFLQHCESVMARVDGS